MAHSSPFLSLLPFLMHLVCGLHVLGQQGQSLVLMAAIQPALEQLTIKQEYWGRREGRGKKWKEGKTIHCIVLLAHGQSGLGWFTEKERLKRGRGQEVQPLKWSLKDDVPSMHKALNQTRTVLGSSSHTHTHVAMLKKEKSGESSERCVKKVRRMDEKWISLTYDMLFIKIKMILRVSVLGWNWNGRRNAQLIS